VGELGYDTSNDILKVGDGATNWLSLPDADSQSAAQVVYSNTASELVATTVQGAIDEIDLRLDTIEADDETVGSIAKALKDAKDYADALEADDIAYTDTNKTYALGNNVQAAIYAIDAELISQDGRLDTIEGTGSGSIAKALDDAKDYTDAEILSAQLNLGNNYSVADKTERDGLPNLAVGDVIFVADDDDDK
jgi:hypothetical protein